MNAKVEFIEIGRNKVSWKKDVVLNKEGLFNKKVIFKELKKHLMSNDISCLWNHPRAYFQVYAGMRPVGHFKVIHQTENTTDDFLFPKDNHVK